MLPEETKFGWLFAKRTWNSNKRDRRWMFDWNLQFWGGFHVKESLPGDVKTHETIARWDAMPHINMVFKTFFVSIWRLVLFFDMGNQFYFLTLRSMTFSTSKSMDWFLALGKTYRKPWNFPWNMWKKRGFFIKFAGPKPQAAAGACHCHWRNHRQGTSFYGFEGQ